MFKKRLRVAAALFFGLLALTVVFACYFAVTAKSNKVSAKLKTIYGDSKAAEGVCVTVKSTAVNEVDEQDDLVGITSYSAKVSDGKVIAGRKIHKKEKTDEKKGYYYTSLTFTFPQREQEGVHFVPGSDITATMEVVLNGYVGSPFDEEAKRYVIKEYLTVVEEDVLFYYYDGNGPDLYEAFSLWLNRTNGTSYTRRQLCLLDGEMYGYLYQEPKYEFTCNADRVSDIVSGSSMGRERWDFAQTCEKLPNRTVAKQLEEFGEPELTMTVRKGIYRFDEDGNAVCVLNESDFAEDFSYRWMAADEERGILTVIGYRENQLVAYEYQVEQGTVTEHVIWEDATVAEWAEENSNAYMADVLFDGTKCYLACVYAEGSDNRIVLSVYQDRIRLYEGEVFYDVSDKTDLEDKKLKDFSLDTNGTYWIPTVVDEMEIRVER